jgi:REP element-mobilizing transposase RayT
MPSTYTALHYHVIFATKNREPCIGGDWRGDLHAYVGGILKGMEAHPLGVGGVADHVHVLVSMRPTVCLSDCVRELKKSATAWVRERYPQFQRRFQWQEGYSAFTVSASAREPVRRYIERQEEHHRKKTFSEELQEFLERSGVAYDPRYMD